MERKKVAIYARVSTQDKQDPEVQLVKLREFAAARGWEIYQEYIDRASGADPNRPALDNMLKDARNRRFHAVLIVRLDRITRSIINLLNTLQMLDKWSVSLVCVDQPIETNSPTGRLMIHILAALAEFERELIRERVKDGMEKARRNGKHIGRPARKNKNRILQEIKAILKECPDIPKAQLARRVGIPRSTLYQYLTELSKKEGEGSI